MTSSLLLAVYAIVNGNEAGWTGADARDARGGWRAARDVPRDRVARRLAADAPPALQAAERRTANIVGVLWSAAMFAWFFLSALYLQLVLGYSLLEVGLAFLPANVIMAVFSLGLSAKLVMRFGIRSPIVGGMTLVAIGLALFARAPVDGSFLVDVLPSMLLLGVGAGMALNPVLLAAMSDVAPEESGLASGVVNTAFMMGGALGLRGDLRRTGASSGLDRLGATLDAWPAATTRVRGRHCSAVAAVVAAVAAAARSGTAGVPAPRRPAASSRRGLLRRPPVAAMRSRAARSRRRTLATSSTSPAASSARPTSARKVTFAPNVDCVETPAEPSAFITTTAQSPCFGFHSSVCVPVPDTLCSQMPARAGATGEAVPLCGVVFDGTGRRRCR